MHDSAIGHAKVVMVVACAFEAFGSRSCPSGIPNWHARRCGSPAARMMSRGSGHACDERSAHSDGSLQAE